MVNEDWPETPAAASPATIKTLLEEVRLLNERVKQLEGDKSVVELLESIDERLKEVVEATCSVARNTI